ncbi:MAG TPA: hypothetical protein VHV49_14770 [Pseudonocardiaceae bacterium]|jgi:hypothetical protein|nr:hypothetical protein [Pseudonocardiaceae bacterium]
MRGSIWFWLFIAVVLVLLLGILFGGYRKGTRSLEVPSPADTSISLAHKGF